MTCLACGQASARDAYGAAHDLAALLCLQHLTQALAPGNAPLSSGSQERVPRDRCWGDAIACPHPAKHQGLNARWCDAHRPPVHVVGPPIARATDRTADDGMGDAVLAVLQGLGATILATHPGYYGTLDPLEGQ